MVYWLNKVMGNALTFLYGHCLTSHDHDDDHDHHEAGHHGVSSSTFGVSVLAQHLYNYEINSQVPDGLSKHVKSSKKAQSNWYKKLSKAWRESKPPPKTPEEASRLITHILKRQQRSDVEGLLSFYGLPFPHSLVELPTSEALPLADGLKFELNTLPVDAREVPDGDGINVYISTSDTRESLHVPQEVQKATVERNEALAERNYTKARALHKQIIDANYRVIRINNEDVLARKYRIRLRGIDAPENAMPYGKEAKDELVKITDGQCLKILIFNEDPYGRLVGDVYCNGIFVQKIMLKKGLAWHYTFHDNRPQLAKWENYARSRKIGLWASSNPETPWGWRRNHPLQRLKPCKNGSKNDCPDNQTIEAT